MMQKAVVLIISLMCNQALFATFSQEFLQVKKELEDLKIAKHELLDKTWPDKSERVRQMIQPLIDKNEEKKLKKMVLLEQRWPEIKKELDFAVLSCANQSSTSTANSVIKMPQFSSSCRLSAQFLDMMFDVARIRKNKQLYAELKPYAQKLYADFMDVLSEKYQKYQSNKDVANEFAKQTIDLRLSRDG
jgi:hypothetical protein